MPSEVSKEPVSITLKPHLALQKLIKSYHIIHDLTGAYTLCPGWNRQFLTLHYGDSTKLYTHSGRALETLPALINGTYTGPVHPSVEPVELRFIAVEFQPFILGQLIGENISNLTGETVTLDTFFSTDEVNLLSEQLSEVENHTERISALDQFFFRNCKKPFQPEIFLNYAHHLLKNSINSNISESTLAENLQYSPRHIRRRFKEVTGVTPHEYHRMLRVEMVIKELLRPADDITDWAKFAYRHGYYDQSHFYRNFKKFTGFTPETFIDQQPYRLIQGFFF